MNLYLIGYRGSGKTTVARCLADLLHWPWTDADQLLERQAGCTIKEIFEREGESGFRERETSVLAELAARERQIVALGGGAVLREDNRAALATSGKTVWLQASPELLWSRISGDPTTAARRPNLTGQGGLEEVRLLLDQRQPLYEQCADLVLETDGKSPESLAANIAAWLARDGRNAMLSDDTNSATPT